ncbi:MAG: DNA translocase FtsK 4TM domain-containing protein [Patescibacteria group bacterium]|jgi:S-DNA-T family DNA segregation ATPase FtsK/SpoIIIE
MAARRTLRRRRDEEEEREEASPELSPESRRGIIIVILGLVAVLTILSFFGIAGDIGEAIEGFTSLTFGWWQYALPVVVVFIAYAVYKEEQFPWTVRAWLGLVFFILSSTALLSIFLDADLLGDIASGEGGGAVGYILAWPLVTLFGSWASLVVLVAVFLIALLLFFNTTLRELAGHGSRVWGIFASVSDAVSELKIRMQDYRTRRVMDKEQEADFKRRRIDPSDLQGDDDEDAEDTEEEDGEENEPDDAEPDAAVEEHEDDEPEQGRMALTLKKRKASSHIAFPLNLLNRTTEQPAAGNVERNKTIILDTLQNFGIEVELGEVSIGPTVTQYTLKPSVGVKVSQITTLSNDLALALAAHPIRIEAPIPGRSLVGIEVPNKQSALVTLRDVLETDESRKHKSQLALAVGRDVAGSPWVLDLDSLPHLLIAGATGSGKSVMINTVILNLLQRNSPDDLKLILVDPKRVELSLYNNVPHLLTPVITESNKTINALRWVVSEMDRRYIHLSEAKKRNIAGFRAAGYDMPYIVVVIDELADLMVVAANEVEGAIVRLAQMARAVGIHLVVATQRPSVNVITGLIKANITARMAFNVASSIDSRTILDMSGAEKLLGKGDFLLVTAELSKPKRLQGALVTEEEIERVTAALRKGADADYDMDVIEKAQAPHTMMKNGVMGSGDDEDEDPMLADAKQVILRAGKGSASLLQRRLSIGYARAARILDILEEQGFIGPADGAKPREVLRDLEDEEFGESFEEEEPEDDEDVEKDDTHNEDVQGDDGEEEPVDNEATEEVEDDVEDEKERYENWTRS